MRTVGSYLQILKNQVGLPFMPMTFENLQSLTVVGTEPKAHKIFSEDGA
jgi:hypothetical protein